MYYHNKSIAEALQYTFPEVDFDESKFSLLYLWEDKHKRREFFEAFAKANNFDPLDKESWYMQSRAKIASTEGALGIASYYRKRRSLAKALVDLFPDISLDANKIFSMTDTTYQRRFFEKFATERGFDPLNPYNWYSLHRNSILSVRGAFAIMSYHNQSIAQALQDLFPDLQWDPAKFLYIKN